MRKANEIDDFDDEEEYSEEEEEEDIDFEHDNQDHIQLISSTPSTIINSIVSTIPIITTTTTTSTSLSSDQTATMDMKTVNEKSSSSRLLARCLCFFYSFSLLPRYIHM